MSEADYGELIGICTGIALLIPLATTLTFAQDENDHHGLYISLQSLHSNVYLTAACA